MVDTPRQINAYEVLQRLGSGGMGETFLAVDHDCMYDSPVCLKLIREDRMDEPDLVARFQEEARILSRLEHNNVVCLLNTGKVDGRLYYVQEYMNGGDLATLLEEVGTLSPTQVAYLAGELLKALVYLHRREQDGDYVLHRDLTPQNVLINSAGEIKIADFGIAKTVAHTQTVPSMLGGTPGFMSPEVFSKSPLDGRSDLWSVGTILYHALTGEVPFQGANAHEVIALVATNARPNVRERAPKDTPESLITLIEHLLQCDPQRRPESAKSALGSLMVPGDASLDFRQAVEHQIALRPDMAKPAEAIHASNTVLTHHPTLALDGTLSDNSADMDVAQDASSDTGVLYRSYRWGVLLAMMFVAACLLVSLQVTDLLPTGARADKKDETSNMAASGEDGTEKEPPQPTKSASLVTNHSDEHEDEHEKVRVAEVAEKQTVSLVEQTEQAEQAEQSKAKSEEEANVVTASPPVERARNNGKPGTLSVITHSFGSYIWIDGTQQDARAPGSVPLSPGAHRVGLSNTPGRRPLRYRSVTVKSGRVTSVEIDAS